MEPVTDKLSRDVAASKCLEVLDGAFLKALAEPARQAILRELILHRRADVSTIAGKLPQDRSVIARHLQILERAAIVRSSVEGRHTFYQLDGDGISRQMENLSQLVRVLTPICCP